MVAIEFPKASFRIHREAGREMIFDSLRRRWVKLTPEEWVRQNIINYLVQEKKYPAALIAVEKSLRLGELLKRFDLLVYNSNLQPWMLIECKSMDVKLEDSVLQQVLRYNIAIPVSYLVISNGHYCAAYHRTDSGLQSLDAFPDYGT